MHNIVVISIEGLDYNFLQDNLGELPNINKLQSEGVYGKINHKTVPNEPVAWGTILTGQNPGEFGFWNHYYRDSFKYILSQETNLNSLQIETLNSYLPKNGKVAAFINIPLLSQAPVVHGGFSISKSIVENFINTWPTDLINELYEKIDSIKDFKKIKKHFSSLDAEEKLKFEISSDNLIFDILEYIIKNKNSDCILSYINGSLKIHKFYYDLNKKEQNREKINVRLNNSLKKYFGFIDKRVGKISEVLNEYDSLLIFSPYSLLQPSEFINLNIWLMETGYLTLNKYSSKIDEFDEKTVDWKKTKAWSIGNCGHIYINLKGREKNGIVKKKDYYFIINEIVESLKNEKFFKNHKINVEAILREDVFYGDKECFGPDIFVSFNSGEYKTNPSISDKEIISQYVKQNVNSSYFPNQNNGYFLLKCPQSKYTGSLKNIGLLNLAPTILDILKVKIPYEMEQSILNIINTIDIKRDKKDIEDKHIMSRLESLGY